MGVVAPSAGQRDDLAVLLLDDLTLYQNHEHYRRHFRWPPGSEPAKTIRYHLIWIGRLTEHHELCLKSLLLTQPACDVWLWMPEESMRDNELFLDGVRRVPTIRVQPYVPEVEARGTPFEKHLDLLVGGSPERISDGFRLLVQWKYGGVYADMDTVFLRDMSCLCSAEFTYQWSHHPIATNAISHFNVGSQALEALVHRSIRIQSCHPRYLLKLADVFELPGEFYMLPSFAFDPAWIARDTGSPDNPYVNRFEEFFGSTAAVAFDEFFPESFAYQWHGQWGRAVRPGTLIGLLHADVCARFHALGQRRGWRVDGLNWTARS